jgi:hypothetical protein
VIELEYGITVYPSRHEGDRWRAVWYENGQRQQCESVKEAKLAAELERVTERLEADAPNMKRTGADLIAHYLDPDRLPVERRWSRKHAHTQRRLCERFAASVIDTIMCQDIKTLHTRQIVNAAPTAGEGARVAGMISAGGRPASVRLELLRDDRVAAALVHVDAPEIAGFAGGTALASVVPTAACPMRLAVYDKRARKGLQKVALEVSPAGAAFFTQPARTAQVTANLAPAPARLPHGATR